ncbi:hypothetical protein AAHB66_02610 [Leclercia sp. S52]|uniref:hypothetical protein n=1 Tax=Leclercia sp. S52 TaxID=3138178 RepID=UPI003219A0E2
MKPEESVRQKVIKKLEAAGWSHDRLRWKPEWPIPATPHDLSKREKGQKYNIAGSADLVAFADNSGASHALQVIFEFKAPHLDSGREQLMRYLSMEPMAKLGFWTNGSASLAIYKRHVNDWLFVEGAPLPQPDDDLTRPPRTTSDMEHASASHRCSTQRSVTSLGCYRRGSRL